ncbi:hypothetical protein ASG99_15070 [Bacillus sp. Soil768D1]|nr:hypothetical protein ASG99_15070 [Bacillus sp. Soil768D1]
MELTSNVLFPAQIPFKVLISAFGKNSANKVQEKSNYLNMQIKILENYQSEGKRLSEKLNLHLEGISKVKALMHTQLEFFSEVFEQIHNRPTYNVSFEGCEMTNDELFRHSNIDSDFAQNIDSNPI